ncbi:hypothetical protein [Chromobacterium amazonense]|uniref:hypothetical protein n=1 Tax=Chromobacterium amazonense TaxID=1382803 RepID=UPI003F7A5823
MNSMTKPSNTCTVYAWHKKQGDGARALVEAQFSRIKRCIGDRLLTKRTASRQNEGVMIANLINIWNAFGKCQAMTTAWSRLEQIRA